LRQSIGGVSPQAEQLIAKRGRALAIEFIPISSPVMAGTSPAMTVEPQSMIAE